MSECCSVMAEAPCAVSRREVTVCPGCSTKAKPIATITVKSLVRDHMQVSAEDTFWLCRAPSCDVVYFSDNGIFRKSDLKVRVGFKEQEDPIPLCYCFDYTRSDITRDLSLNGEADIPKKVKAEVHRGFCACEVKNPSGACCLGDLNRIVKEFERTSPEQQVQTKSFV